MKRIVLLGCVLAAGCTVMEKVGVRPPAPEAEPPGVPLDATKPPPQDALTVEQLDTTTPAERAEAAVADPGGAQSLGLTVASLGAATEPGFWLKTPLVSSETQGRVVYPVTGKSAAVTLIPIEGAATAGSRLSLAAFRLIEAPLTGLPEIEVFAGG